MSALCGFIVAVILAASVLKMPALLISNAAMHGFVFGFFQIAWIIIASIFLYNIALETGQFEVMKQSIAGLSRDVRVQTILIAFCFGAFLEGTGGGGAPVAIAGSFLIGLGFPPFQAAIICLIANTAPVAWGGVGNPVRVLAGVTGLPEHAFNAVLGRILPPFALILPLYMMLILLQVEEDPRGSSGAARERRIVRGDAVCLVQLRRNESRRHHLSHLLVACHGGLSQILETEKHSCQPRTWNLRQFQTIPSTRF